MSDTYIDNGMIVTVIEPGHIIMRRPSTPVERFACMWGYSLDEAERLLRSVVAGPPALREDDDLKAELEQRFRERARDTTRGPKPKGETA
jgi:hypothetical protein